MMGRAGSWIGSTIQGLAAARFWFYQDFAAGSGPGLTITTNSNGSGGPFVFNSANIVNSSAVVTKTNGNPIYTSTTEIPANLVTVSSHTGASVTLSGTPAVGEGTIRIWYLYVAQSDEVPDDIELAPHFVISARTQYLDTQFLDSALNLSDLGNASTARTNLGFTAQTAGRVLLGDGGTTFTSDSLLFYDTTNDRLAIGISSPDYGLHFKAQGTSNDDGIMLEGFGAGAARQWLILPDSTGFLYFRNLNETYFSMVLDNTGKLGVGKASPAGQLHAFPRTSGTIVSIFQGESGQSVNLTEWQDNSANVLAFVNQAGSAQFPTVTLKTSLVFEDPDAGTNTITLQAPTTLAGNYTLTLPTTDGGANEVLTTDGSGVLSWVAGGTGTVASGTAGNLALYPTSTTTVDDIYVQNSNNINIAIASHAALAASRTYTIDEVGASASFVMTQGAQTLAGIKTFSATPLFKTAVDLEDPAGGTNKITIQAPTLSGDYTLTLPTTDGAAGQFLKTDGSGVLTWERPLLQKAGTVNLTNGSLSQAISFATAFGSANYVVHWQFVNTTDSDPLIQPVSVMAKATTGFTVEWLQVLDSANYVGVWSIEEYYDP